MSDIISLRQMQIGQSGRIATVEALEKWAAASGTWA